MEEWSQRPAQPSDLDKSAYAVLKVLGRKYAFMDWWNKIPPEKKEGIFAEIRDAIRYGHMD